MTLAEYQEIAAASMERDPSTAPFGYLSGGSFVLDSTRVFCWFETMDELMVSLLEVEPRVYDLDEDAINSLRARVEPIIASIRSDGLTFELLTQINSEINEFAVIEWWGRFDELTRDNSKFAKDLRMHFRDGEGDGPVSEAEMGEFKEFLQTCFV